MEIRLYINNLPLLNETLKKMSNYQILVTIAVLQYKLRGFVSCSSHSVTKPEEMTVWSL